MSRELVRMMTRYKAWADDLTYAAASDVPERELIKKRPTTFGSIARTLHHVQIVDEIFRAHLEGSDHGFSRRTEDTAPALDALRDNARALNAWWVEFAEAQTPEDLERPVRFKFVSGTDGRMTRGEIILHVVQHATYHRGYVDDMMYQIPFEPPTTDLSAFLCEGG